MKFKRKKPYFIVRENSDNFARWIKAGVSTTKYEEDGNGFLTNNYRVDCKIEDFGEVLKQQTVVTNIANKDIKLKHVSSAYVGGIGEGGLRPWYDDERFLVHYCFSTWQGEGQWRRSSLSELGLFRASNHSCANVIIFNSVGNQTTSMRYPLIFIEDRELGKTWFFEIESGTNWYMEIGVEGVNPEGTLYVEMNSAYYNKDGWNKLLKEGEKYTSVPAVFGVVDGGIEKAIRTLNDYKRKNSAVVNENLYVCFNDYMNCLWAKPSEKKLIPLIDKAAEVGCEIFCIDDGWYGYGLESGNIGDWVPDDKKFGEYGFKGIIEYIKTKGMIPGVWLEIDSVVPGTRLAEEYADCLLKINGDAAGSSWRYLLDLRKPRAKAYILGVFDMLYESGVRFVKNDYNQTSGIGYDGTDSYSEELRKCSESFYSIIDEVMAKYPDFMIENCASGGMRTDGATMAHFNFTSTSDQEYYYNNPSIIAGTVAAIQPEKCGIWSYPYPLKYEDRMENAEEFFKNKCTDDFTNGEETAFNMINSMLGVMYLSGHIEYADEKNTELIKEAISLYKDNKDFIKKAYPIFPSGMIKVYENGYFSLGLCDDERILLAVWKIDADVDAKTIDLSEYLDEKAEVKLIYPTKLKTEFNFINKKLTVKLDEKYSARLFEIKL